MAPVAPQIMPGLGYFLSHPSLDLLCSRISELWVHFPREKQSHSCYGVLWVSLNSARTGRKSGISQCWSTTAGWEHSSKKVCDWQTLPCRALISCAKEQTRNESMEVFYVWTLLGAALGFWRIWFPSIPSEQGDSTKLLLLVLSQPWNFWCIPSLHCAHASKLSKKPCLGFHSTWG